MCTSMLVLVLAGCTIEVPAPKQFDCGDFNKETGEWYCLSRTTDKCIRNMYVETEQCNNIKGE